MARLHRIIACSVHVWGALLLLHGGCSFPDPRIGTVQCERDADCQVAGRNCEVAHCDADRKCANSRLEDGEDCSNDEGGRYCSPDGCVRCVEAEQCDDGDDCVAAQCVAVHCNNSEWDVPLGETGPDCGGPDCLACPAFYGCIDDTDCLSGACDMTTMTCLDCDASICAGFCTEDGTCKELLPNGSPCLANAECASNICDIRSPTEPGKCCNMACGQLCFACDGSHTQANDGECAPVSANDDPYNDCVLACNGNGACALL